MKTKRQVRQSPEVLESLFQGQLRGMRRSAEAYDRERDFAETARLATAIRVLVHETKQSHGLVGQVGRKATLFYDSADADALDNALAYAPLVAIALAPSGPVVVPRLDDFPHAGEARRPFGAWWNRTIYRDRRGRAMTRRDLVLTVANQDGGAHVDPEIDETYHDMSREASLDVSTGDGVALDGADHASLRQIAHEVFKTFDPAYTLRRAQPSVPFGGFLMPKATMPGIAPWWRDRLDAVARGKRPPKPCRNDPCPCASGLKWKRCHGASTG